MDNWELGKLRRATVVVMNCNTRTDITASARLMCAIGQDMWTVCGWPYTLASIQTVQLQHITIGTAIAVGHVHRALQLQKSEINFPPIGQFKLSNGVSHMQIDGAASEIHPLKHSAIARGALKSFPREVVDRNNSAAKFYHLKMETPIFQVFHAFNHQMRGKW